MLTRLKTFLNDQLFAFVEWLLYTLHNRVDSAEYRERSRPEGDTVSLDLGRLSLTLFYSAQFDSRTAHVVAGLLGLSVGLQISTGTERLGTTQFYVLVRDQQRYSAIRHVLRQRGRTGDHDDAPHWRWFYTLKACLCLLSGRQYDATLARRWRANGVTIRDAHRPAFFIREFASWDESHIVAWDQQTALDVGYGLFCNWYYNTHVMTGSPHEC